MKPERIRIAVIGAGPAGLAAAEALVAAGHCPVLFEAKPSPARKFLMAGKSGLNLTKDEPPEAFAAAFSHPRLRPLMKGYGPDAIRAWAEGLGEPLFTGSSGRVFPVAMKASPFLRKWLTRLRNGGAEMRTRWRWTGGWRGGALTFETPQGRREVMADATILALGGASWSRLGSDGDGVRQLGRAGVPVVPFAPANMGFERGWSDVFRDRYAGAPVKPVSMTLADSQARSVGTRSLRGEFVIARYGVEGSAIYAMSAPLREALKAGGAMLLLDLAPDRRAEALTRRLSRPRGKLSRANFLRRTIGLSGVRAALLRELAPDLSDEPAAIARMVKALPMPVTRPRPLDEAISSAGGIAWDALDETLMLRSHPGVFAAGEMLDWEAPTGGYLLSGCLATGRHAGAAAARWLNLRTESAGAP